mmetsp:Transcript_7767/g.17045  ORF Transcript_7767/g.17045 Transcript_7767/m.17045 type:complete len:134 (-) Transcript_7767:204-605(-)
MAAAAVADSGGKESRRNSDNALSIFFVENPDGVIDSIAGADSIEPPPTNPQLRCYHCNTLLEYTAGASYVQCFLCRTMNAVQRGSSLGGRTMSMLCTVCATSNLAPWGTYYVRCGQCNIVSDVTHIYAATAFR